MLVPFGENFIVVEKNILHEINNYCNLHHSGSSTIAAKADFEKVTTCAHQCEHAEDDDEIKYHDYHGVCQLSFV